MVRGSVKRLGRRTRLVIEQGQGTTAAFQQCLTMGQPRLFVADLFPFAWLRCEFIELAELPLQALPFLLNGVGVALRRFQSVQGPPPGLPRLLCVVGQIAEVALLVKQLALLRRAE